MFSVTQISCSPTVDTNEYLGLNGPEIYDLSPANFCKRLKLASIIKSQPGIFMLLAVNENTKTNTFIPANHCTFLTEFVDIHFPEESSVSCRVIFQEGFATYIVPEHSDSTLSEENIRFGRALDFIRTKTQHHTSRSTPRLQSLYEAMEQIVNADFYTGPIHVITGDSEEN